MPPAHNPSPRRRWDLWNLQALDPDASAATLAALESGRRACDELARRILRDGEGDHAQLRAEARAFLSAHRELHRGLVLGLHLGPYSLIPGLYLDLGLSPVVLLDRAAHDRLRADADRQRRALGLSGEPEWLVTDRPAFAGRLLRCLREGRPVLVFLDGNSGEGGMAATRDRGLTYRLPGRDLRVRTGLGRLLGHAHCPVHALTVRWRPDGSLLWEAGAPEPWPAGADPATVTVRLYDWLFAEVRRSPEQWSAWGMLGAASACFASERLAVDPLELQRREIRFLDALAHRPDRVRIALRAGVEVWEPGILADTRGEAFYAAEGLRDASLDLLRAASPTLTELRALCGRRWVEGHARRLATLGLADLVVA